MPVMVRVAAVEACVHESPKHGMCMTGPFALLLCMLDGSNA